MAGKRVIGFDVFDTLVRRRIEPEAVKDRVAVMLADLLGPEVDWTLIRHRRTVLEEDFVEERTRSGCDGEFHHEEIVRRWIDEVYGGRAPAGIAERVIAHELELERRAQAPIPHVPDLLGRLHASGRRLVFVSDMYFSAREIRSFLDHLGIGGYFASGYSSCDSGTRKRTGRLFRHVLAEEGIAPADLLFVGDNPQADVEPARRLGVSVIHVIDPHERKRRLCHQMAVRAARRGGCWPGYLARDVVETIPRRVRANGSPPYQLGLVMAFPYIAFVLHVIESLQRQPAGEVYFLAREGWLLLRLYRRLVAALDLANSLPRGRYLFISRLSTFLPSMRRLDWPELKRIWRQYNTQSMRVLLANLRLPEAEFAPLAREAGIHDLDAPLEHPEHDVGFRRFLHHPEVQRRFTAHRDAARVLLRAYLTQVGALEASELLFVDVGWKGSMQANVCRAFEQDPAFPIVRGLYFGLLDDAAPGTARMSMDGFLVTPTCQDHLSRAVFRCVTPFEMTATAPHGSVVGYARPGRRAGRVVPVLVNNAAECRYAARINEVQQAIDDYVADFVACLGLFDARSDVLRGAAVDSLLRYIQYPTRREARVFADYEHVESFGVHGVSTLHWKVPVRRIIRATWPRAMFEELWQALSRELWPQLAALRTRLPLAQFAFDVRNTLLRVR